MHVFSRALSFSCPQYNGCLWKGGRLRVDVAKDHVTVKLKKEEAALAAARAAKAEAVAAAATALQADRPLQELNHLKLWIEGRESGRVRKGEKKREGATDADGHGSAQRSRPTKEQKQ